MYARSCSGFLLACATLAACAGAPVAPTEAVAVKAPVHVTLLLFSGRPDPVFGVDEKFVAETLRPRLAEARPVTSAAAAVPGLGYHGIRVENVGGVPGLARSLFIYRQDVEVREDAKASILRDENASLESALLQEAVAKGVIDAKVLDAIGRK